MKYRYDIDGLRAIAIIFVLAFHGGLTVFPSGFIGVDMFFVISGFLITSITINSMKNNNFSFFGFYRRRLWRLQPALIATVLFTFLLAVLFYLPSDFIDYVNSARYTTLLISNQFFERSTTGYAAPEAAYLLLLHTWSLSIEWQWYLLLPASIIFMHRYLSDRSIKTATLLLVVITTILSIALSAKYPDKSYYFFTSRIFEFLIGSSLVILGGEKYKPGKTICYLFGIISFLTLMYCATRVNIVLGYPDYHALMACLATALLIWAGIPANSIVSRLLSLPPLVILGRLSYSLYLWHWPIFAVGRYLGFKENLVFTITCYTLTLLLSCISYVFIEKPCRKKSNSFPTSFSILVLIPIIIFVALYSLTERYNGFSGRFGADYSRMTSTLDKYASPNRESCLNGNEDEKNSNCIIGDTAALKKALLIGDSHSNHFWNFIDLLAKDAHVSVMVQGTSTCLALPGISQFDWGRYKNNVYKDCHDNVARYYDNIQKEKFDYVIIGEVWNHYTGDNIINKLGDARSEALSRQRIEVAMRKAMGIIVKSGAKPVIIKTIYIAPKEYVPCFYQNVKLRAHNKDASCERGVWNGDGSDWFNQLFKQLKTEYPSLIIIDPKRVQCSGKNCVTEIDGIPVYRDYWHLTDHASFIFGKEYLARYGNPLKN